jgi:hypothetical protein
MAIYLDFLTIWYIFPVLVYCTRKNMATLNVIDLQSWFCEKKTQSVAKHIFGVKNNTSIFL